MALVECKECGGEVSTIANSCPHCGAVYDFSATATENEDEISTVSIDLKFNCPNCSTELTADSSFSGQEFECPDCGVNVTVPQNPNVRIEGNPSEDSTNKPPPPSRQTDGRQESSGLKPCYACGYNISTESKSCQHCGAPTPKAMVRGPAIALIILSLFYLIGLGYHNGLHWSDGWGRDEVRYQQMVRSMWAGAPSTTDRRVEWLRTHGPIMDGTSSQEKASRMTHMILGPTLLIIHSIIFLCAVSMVRMRSYKWAKFGAVLSVIPISSACLVVGIPFGFWALAALKKPETMVAFNESEQQQGLKTNVNTPLLCLLMAGILIAVGFWFGIERGSALKSRHEEWNQIPESRMPDGAPMPGAGPENGEEGGE